MAPEDPLRHGLDRVAVGDVAQLDLATELLRERPQPVLAPRDEHAVPSLLREQPCDRLADPRRRAGHDGDAGARWTLIRHAATP